MTMTIPVVQPLRYSYSPVTGFYEDAAGAWVKQLIPHERLGTLTFFVIAK